MGFPVGYSGRFLKKLILLTLSLLGFIRKLFRFREPDIAWPPLPESHSVSAELVRDVLPVVKFLELAVDPSESCAVCLQEFDGGNEIRPLPNCRHIFHRSCLDRWIDNDQRTGPLCRTRFVHDDLLDSFNEKIWVLPEISNFSGW